MPVRKEWRVFEDRLSEVKKKKESSKAQCVPAGESENKEAGKRVTAKKAASLRFSKSPCHFFC